MFGEHLEMGSPTAFHSSMGLGCNFKAKGVWLWEIFTQRVKYPDLYVKKNPSAKDNGIADHRHERDSPVDRSWQSLGINSPHGQGKGLF